MERDFLLQYPGWFYFHALGHNKDMYPQKHDLHAEHQKDACAYVYVRFLFLCSTTGFLWCNLTHKCISFRIFHFYTLGSPNTKLAARGRNQHTLCA